MYFIVPHGPDGARACRYTLSTTAMRHVGHGIRKNKLCRKNGVLVLVQKHQQRVSPHCAQAVSGTFYPVNFPNGVRCTSTFSTAAGLTRRASASWTQALKISVGAALEKLDAAQTQCSCSLMRKASKARALQRSSVARDLSPGCKACWQTLHK